MQDYPTANEVSVLQKFSARAMDIQGQLNEDYEGDRYLRDRMQGAIDVPALK